MHLMWCATTYLYLTAAVTAVLVGSARDILITASLAGVLAFQRAMRRHLNVLPPVASPAMAAHARSHFQGSVPGRARHASQRPGSVVTQR